MNEERLRKDAENVELGTIPFQLRRAPKISSQFRYT